VLCDEHPEFKEAVYIPYANYLAENDKFDEAQEAYYIAGKYQSKMSIILVDFPCFLLNLGALARALMCAHNIKFHDTLRLSR